MANHSTKLKIGDRAPDFNISDQTGKMISLKNLLTENASGKNKKIIIYFYPKDDTPTCTKEACNLRDNYKDLTEKGFTVLGVSADEEKKHTKFIKKYDLPYQLLADTKMEMIKAYDVWGEKLFMGRIFDGIVRTTFVIDKAGIIEKVITKVDSGNHTQQILGPETT